MVTVGITGSYGKTTVKEYLGAILGESAKVLVTPAHMNVDNGIAKFALENLDDSYDFFVVEMGAYRKNEIKSIASIVQPDYGILTAIANQHMELFGSQEAIIKGNLS